MRLSLMLTVLLLALPAAAKEIADVKVPESVTVEGKELKLNGAGLRKKFGLAKVYVAGFYLEKPSKDAGAIIAADAIRQMHLTMKRDLTKAKMLDTLREGVERNSADKIPAIKDRLDKLSNAFQKDLKEGDDLVVTYVPGKGTTVEHAQTKESVTIEGKDFADALFLAWLGKDPADSSLKEALLGQD